MRQQKCRILITRIFSNGIHKLNHGLLVLLLFVVLLAALKERLRCLGPCPKEIAESACHCDSHRYSHYKYSGLKGRHESEQQFSYRCRSRSRSHSSSSYKCLFHIEHFYTPLSQE